MRLSVIGTGYVGLVAGAGVLTKATALLLLPWIAVAYLVEARRTAREGGRPWPVVATGAVTAVVVAVLSGWWFVGNQRRHGSFAPTLEEKVDICQNAIDLVISLGVEHPKLAILAAVESVNSKMPATLDAAAEE